MELGSATGPKDYSKICSFQLRQLGISISHSNVTNAYLSNQLCLKSKYLLHYRNKLLFCERFSHRNNFTKFL